VVRSHVLEFHIRYGFEVEIQAKIVTLDTVSAASRRQFIPDYVSTSSITHVNSLMSTTSPSPTKPPTLALVQAHIHPFLKSYALHRPLISRILTLSFVCFAFTSTYRSLTSSSSPSTSSRSSRSGKGGKGRRGRGGVQVKVDGVFWERLSRLLRIVIPGWRSREAGMLGVHSALLCLRTGLSLYVADLDGRQVVHIKRSRERSSGGRPC
jgi:hypothetical protein